MKTRNVDDSEYRFKVKTETKATQQAFFWCNKCALEFEATIIGECSGCGRHCYLPPNQPIMVALDLLTAARDLLAASRAAGVLGATEISIHEEILEKASTKVTR